MWCLESHFKKQFQGENNDCAKNTERWRKMRQISNYGFGNMEIIGDLNRQIDISRIKMHVLLRESFSKY